MTRRRRCRSASCEVSRLQANEFHRATRQAGYCTHILAGTLQDWDQLPFGLRPEHGCSQQQNSFGLLELLRLPLYWLYLALSLETMPQEQALMLTPTSQPEQTLMLTPSSQLALLLEAVTAQMSKPPYDSVWRDLSQPES